MNEYSGLLGLRVEKVRNNDIDYGNFLNRMTVARSRKTGRADLGYHTLSHERTETRQPPSTRDFRESV